MISLYLLFPLNHIGVRFLFLFGAVFYGNGALTGTEPLGYEEGKRLRKRQESERNERDIVEMKERMNEKDGAA